MASIQARRDEILSKKAKLAELKRQRELRQREFSQGRLGHGHAESQESIPSSIASRTDGGRAELDSLVSRLVDRPSAVSTPKDGTSLSGSHGPGHAVHDSISSPRRSSRPNSVLSVGQWSLENADAYSPHRVTAFSSSATQTEGQATTVPGSWNGYAAGSGTMDGTEAGSSTLEANSVRAPEIVTYSKGVQTDPIIKPGDEEHAEDSDDEDGNQDRSAEDYNDADTSRPFGRKKREKDDDIRARLRREVEKELHAMRETAREEEESKNQLLSDAAVRYPLRTLTNVELNAVTSSDDFLDFVDKSSKVIERALDEEYDILADYSIGGLHADGANGDHPASEEFRDIKEAVQFWDERQSKKRMISDIHFSPWYPELVLASYTNNITAPHEPNGLVQVWNQHLRSEAEYTFHSTSDILTARFSPFHPNLIVGGSYSGQVLLWDTRQARAGGGAPVLKTPLTGSGHTHPIYSINIVGTQNAHNIITASTDGAVCAWTVDMFTTPQEYLELTTPPPAKTEDLAPTAVTFPQSDPTFFLVGTEEGSIYPCHRYDRAGAKAGTDQRLSYKGHAAPVMSTDFHPSRGPVDLGDLMLSSSLDWSVKLWRVRAPAATLGGSGAADSAIGGSGSGGASGISASTAQQQTVSPILDITREDIVYDASWAPHRPGVFALVDGAGYVEVWDLANETEVPVARQTPSKGRGAVVRQSLNKVAWEEKTGRKLAVGGLDGVLSVFDVGKGLSGGPDEVSDTEWTNVKRLVARLEQGRD